MKERANDSFWWSRRNAKKAFPAARPQDRSRSCSVLLSVVLFVAWSALPPAAAALESMQIAMADLDRHSSRVSAEEVAPLGLLLREAIVRTGFVGVIERQRLNDLLAENELQLSDLAAERTILLIGRILPVSSLLLGSVGVLFDHLVISMRLIDVATAETLLAQNVYTNTQRIVQDVSVMTSEVGLRERTLARGVTLDDVRLSLKRRDYRAVRLMFDTYHDTPDCLDRSRHRRGFVTCAPTARSSHPGSDRRHGQRSNFRSLLRQMDSHQETRKNQKFDLKKHSQVINFPWGIICIEYRHL